jgi:hypothetical protein
MPYYASGIRAGTFRRGLKGVGVKEPLVAGLFIAALLLANGFAASYPARDPGHDNPTAPQRALDRWQEEHLEHYTKLRPLLFEEHAALNALCAR